MTLTTYWRRVLVSGPIIWCLLAGAMYLWSIRGALGYRAVTSTSIEIPIVPNVSTATAVVTCSLQTPLRPNHTYGLNCLATSRSLLLGVVTIEVALTASGNGLLISPADQVTRVGLAFGQPAKVADFQITPIASGSQGLVIALNVGDVGGSTRIAQWSLDVELKPIEIIFISALLAFTLATLYSLIVDAITARNRVRALVQARIENAESRAEQAPEKAKFAWELATVRLEAYFDRNLSQVSQVFWLAVAVTVIGFGFVLWGIVASLNQPQFTARAVIAGVSGVITQFIGATFLVIYRSIMAQANEFITVLERINTVGMAVQVLDSIPEDQVELKNSTRSNLVALLVGMKPNLKVPPV